MTQQLITVEEILELDHPAPDARISYGDDPLQFGELRLPPGEGPHPVVVVVHGGCWRSRYDLTHIGAFSAALTEQGVATWTIEYRRVGNPGGGWPGTFADVSAAVDHLRNIASEHPLDLERVVAAGHSAGGHLVLWLAARGHSRLESFAGANPLPLAGVVSLAGVTDLRRALDQGVCDDMTAQLVGGTPSELPDRYEIASPAELAPMGTPQHLVHGELDPIVPADFSRRYARAAREAGDDVQITVVPNAGHFELIAPAAAAWRDVRSAIFALVRSE